MIVHLTETIWAEGDNAASLGVLTGAYLATFGIIMKQVQADQEQENVLLKLAQDMKIQIQKIIEEDNPDAADGS